jgi:hypothetical protein
MINSSPGTGLPVSTEDYVALQRLVHRYADAVVHRNAAQWASCWADDAHWDLGRGRKVAGKAAIVDLWTMAMGGFSAVVQMVFTGTLVGVMVTSPGPAPWNDSPPNCSLSSNGVFLRRAGVVRFERS